jgi:elongation factor P hydroxylase
MHNQELINQYFGNKWKPRHNEYISSPERISRKIKDEEWLLDVGCGFNSFKNYLPNVVGVDPANDAADFKCTIEDYKPDRLFDVAACLGSVNFGTLEVVSNQIEKVVACLKPKARVYWRLNPGRHDHQNNDDFKQIQIFPWTVELLEEFAAKHGFKQTIEQLEGDCRHFRFYVEWHRDAT